MTIQNHTKLFNLNCYAVKSALIILFLLVTPFFASNVFSQSPEGDPEEQSCGGDLEMSDGNGMLLNPNTVCPNTWVKVVWDRDINNCNNTSVWFVEGISELIYFGNPANPIGYINLSNGGYHSQIGDPTEIWVKIKVTQVVRIRARAENCGLTNVVCESQIDFSTGVQPGNGVSVVPVFPATNVVECRSGDMEFDIMGTYQTNSNQPNYNWTIGSGWRIVSGQGNTRIKINNDGKTGAPTLSVNITKNLGGCAQTNLTESLTFIRDFSQAPIMKGIKIYGLLNTPSNYELCDNDGYLMEIEYYTNGSSNYILDNYNISVSSPNGNSKLNSANANFIPPTGQWTGFVNFANNLNQTSPYFWVAPFGEENVQINVQEDYTCLVTNAARSFQTKTKPQKPYFSKFSSDPNCSDEDVYIKVDNIKNDVHYSWNFAQNGINPVYPLLSTNNSQLHLLRDYDVNTIGNQHSVPANINSLEIDVTATTDNCPASRYSTNSDELTFGFNNSANPPSFITPNCFEIGGNEYYPNSIVVSNPELELGFRYDWEIFYRTTSNGILKTASTLHENYGTTCRYNFNGEIPVEITFVCTTDDCNSNPSTTSPTIYNPYVITNPEESCIANEESKKGRFEKKLEFNIFPNPVIDILSVQNEEIGQKHISIFDITGNLKMSKVSNLTLEKLDVSNLPVGQYILSIQSLNNTRYTKFVKE